MWGLRPALMTATSLTSERSGQISAPLRPSDALRGLLRSGPTGEEVAPRQCCHGLRRGTSHPACSTAEVTVCQRLRAHPAPARSVTLSDPSRPAHTRLTSTRVFTPARVALFVRLCQPAPLPSVNRSTTVSPFGWTAGGGVEIRHIAELVGEGRIPVRRPPERYDWPGDVPADRERRARGVNYRF
jgi:hypothetical protein